MDIVSLILVIVGAVNWGLVGLQNLIWSRGFSAVRPRASAAWSTRWSVWQDCGASRCFSAAARQGAPEDPSR